MCTVRPLCPGPDNRLHSSPTSGTSFTDMSPEAIFKGLISYRSDDKAFPPLPVSAQAGPFLCLDHGAGGRPGPAQWSPPGRRPHDVWCGTLRTGQIQGQDQPPGFTRGALESAMQPSLGPRVLHPEQSPF